MLLQSFIDVSPDSHFPIQNLPFGIFQPKGGKPRAGVAIGDLIVDLSALEELGHFRSPEFRGRKPFSEDSLNAFLALGRPAWRKARAVLQRLLSSKTPILRDNARLRARVFHAQKSVTMKLPVRIANYTDFYSSYHHAHNVGTMLRGPGNSLGEPVPIDRAVDHIFGLVLMNDWSARDIQAWEYQPLGPFLAKNFCTSISPWVVTLEALEPFRRPLPKQDPKPMPYLRAKDDFTFDI